MSCNGCRVLRKGCSEDCIIRPCLNWIKNPESQANATVFLAKFYGRAGLMNLIRAGPEHLRPAIFTSLLYEACGRLVNPVYGSAGLLTSGKWWVCQEALESILEGYPIKPFYQEEETHDGDSKLRSGNHRNPRSTALMDVIAKELHKVRNKGRFKIPCATAKHTSVVADGRTDISNHSVLEQLQQKKRKQQGVRERKVRCVAASSDLSCNTAVVAEDATLHLKNKSYDAEDEGVHLELTLGCAQFRSQVSPSMRTQKQEMNLDEQRRGPCMERERYSPSASAFTSLGIGFAAT